MTLTKFEKVEDETETYQAEDGKFDYHIRLDDCSNSPSRNNPWYVDVFNSSETNSDESHIETGRFDEMSEALDFVLGYGTPPA